MKPLSSPLLAAARRRIIVFDGGLGTMLAAPGRLPELLVFDQPDAVRRAHEAFLAAGADVIETDTFNGAANTLAEHGLPERSLELNRRAALLARAACRRFSTRRRPRFVAGSIGPGTKLPSLGQVSFTELRDGYLPQVHGLLAGGVDCLIVETCQDLLQSKAALVAIDEVFRGRAWRVPVFASVTIDRHDRMLAGSDLAAALAALEPFPIAGLGLNCGLGPAGLTAAIRYLATHSSKLLSVMPNAGLPRLVSGRAVYNLAPDDFADQLRRFAIEPGLNIVGGCCGTTPDHIAALAAAVRGISPRRPVPASPRVSSLFRAQEIDVRPRPLLIGERTNASGSRKFRSLLQAGDWDGALLVAREQESEGAHLVDLSVAAAGRNETHDLAEACARFNAHQPLPVMVDCTDPAAVEAALQRLAGRAIVNSASLADPARARKIVALCRRYGAALVLMTVDRRGMALTARRKLAVARRLYELAVRRGGLAPDAVFFDFLTFTLGSGEPSLRGAARETLLAVRRAKRRFPASFTLLGVSNVSHGLPPAARRALNSVFLHRAVAHGLDAAILHAGRIVPLGDLAPAVVRACDDLILDRRRHARPPLERLLAAFDRVSSAQPVPAPASPDERLRHAVLHGDPSGLAGLLAHRPPLQIVNRVLLPAMAEVGRRFESGRMQLPFVLRSAETMRRALALLRPRLGAASATCRGTIVIGTVRGDIHDIGKNLVAMILESNGFRVIDIGVRRTPGDFLAAIRRHRPDAVGMSGLLVESARAMREYVEEFDRAGLKLPLLLGGAALDAQYVRTALQPGYSGPVRYAPDAIAGLRLMQQIVGRAAS